MPAPIFGKYEVIKRLAVGGMGEVFLARQTGIPGFERHAILKSLLPDVAEQAGAIDEFLDEARVAATLNHPNVVSIYEVGLWENIYYIAMEFIDGENLAGLRRAALACGQFVPFEVTARIIRDAADGLDHAHRAKDMSGKPMDIVHRDISPQNIMVRRDGVTKVVDFGIARAANRSTRTKTGMTKGKLAYMPPEQVRGMPVDGRSDQYALGVVLWELLTGKRLFQGESDVELMKMVLRSEIPRPTEVDPSVPAELESIAMQMMQKDPDSRFPSCHDVANSLAAWLEQVAPGLGTAEVSAFVVAVYDGWKASAEAPSKSNQNFVIDLHGSNSAGASIVTGPHNSQAALPAGSPGSAESASAKFEALTSVKPRLAPADAREAVPTPSASAASGSMPTGPEPSPSRPQTKRTAMLVGLGVATMAAVIGIGGALTHQETPHPLPPVTPPLAVAPPAAPLARASFHTKADTAVLVVDGPAGATVFVDGVRWKAQAPCEIGGLSAGAHRIKLVLPTGVELPEETSTISAPAPAKLSIRSDPSGADVLLAGGVLGTTPLDTDKIPPGSDQELEVRKAGYASEKRTMKLVRGSNPDLVVKLSPMRKTKVATTVAANNPHIEPPRPVPPMPTEARYGYLSINTNPFTSVKIDGDVYGSTPLFKKKLSVGTHQVDMVNDGANIHWTKTVIVKAEDITKLTLP